MEILAAFSMAAGIAVAAGIKWFISAFMGYVGLKLAIKIFGPLDLFKK